MRAMLIGLASLLGVSAACFETEPPTKMEIERDLELDVKLKSAKTIQPGQHIALEMALVNKSKTKTYPIVKPGDGSSVGWREPHVYYTAQRQLENGQWENAPNAPFGRCGLFDFDWQKDVTNLASGAKLELKSWLPGPADRFEFQEPGRHRVYVHYKYQAGLAGKGGERDDAADLGKMAGIPAFEIVSEPIDLEVVRPLDVVVKVKTDLEVHAKTTLSELLSIELVNRSEKPVEVTSPTLHGGSRLSLEIQGQFGGWRPDLTKQRSKNEVKLTLKPDQSLAVLGEGEFANGLDGEWEYPVEDTVKVRAVYRASMGNTGAVIKSDWVEVKVE